MLPTAGPTASGSGTTFDGFVNDEGGQVFNVTNPAYGAKGNTLLATGGGAITAGSASFTQSAAGGQTSTGNAVSFVAGDVGKVITVQGAAANGKVLQTTITSVTNATTVTLAQSASTTASNAGFSYGTDDTAGLLAAIAAAGDKGTLFVPAGFYTILGASNGGKPITLAGRGGMRGGGGKGDNSILPNTFFLCGDVTAGILTTGTARYDGFVVHGNNVATAPLQCGATSGGTVTGPSASHATFFDVRVTASAGTGWAIYGTQNATFYDCATNYNGIDGLYIDGGASGLTFFHFEESGNARYGLHGDQLVKGAGGSTGPTEHISFYSGILDTATGFTGVSKIYLRNAINWSFPGFDIPATNMTGPAVDLDQSQGYGLDFSYCWFWTPQKSTNPGQAAIQINGTPPAGIRRTFVKTDGCYFISGDNSIYIKDAVGDYQYSAIGWEYDSSTNGPFAAPGLPAIDTLLTGRTGPWQSAVVNTAAWSGTVYYRVMAEGWVELKGNVKYSGAGGGTIFTLPLGYRPDGASRVLPASVDAGLAVITMSTAGDVSASPIAGGTFAAGASLYFDGLTVPVGGA